MGRTIDGMATRLRQIAAGSVAELARKAGVKEAAMYTYTTGRTQPPLEVLVAVADVTGASLEWLICGEGSGPDGGMKLLGQGKSPETMAVELAGVRVSIRVEEMAAKAKGT